MASYIDPTKEAFAVFKDLPREGVIHMLNMIRFRKKAAYPDGREVTGREAYKNYARESGPIFARSGGQLFWLSRFEHVLIGPPEEYWDLVFIAQYPGADAFIEMIRNPEYQEAAKHRQAAVEDSRLIRLRPSPSENGFSGLL